MAEFAKSLCLNHAICLCGPRATGKTPKVLAFCELGQRERERRAVSKATRDRQVAAHSPRQLAADRQAQPDAGRRIARLFAALDERLEDALELVRWNTRPGVVHEDVNRPWLAEDA